ncbi:short-chain dehydrogenase [Aspergillus granulosus]|uniref:Short-chain dehydrogenase n=1 Tax=Aspergillus granulosus TaxID=176169 RepID=A0ABR4HF75_9EURO
MSLPRRSTFFHYKPPLTEKNLPSQQGKVFIITGASSGIGKELASILYAHHAKIYLATRAEAKTNAVIDEIRRLNPQNPRSGFLARESRLDVLWNNAAVMVPPKGSVSVQGHELQFAVNNLGHFLFTKLLHPLLVKTANSEGAAGRRGTVRVIWVSSSAADHVAIPAIDFSNMDYRRRGEGIWSMYARSKAGNVLQAVEYARRVGEEGVLSLTLNPGNFLTGLQKTMPRWQVFLFKLVAQDPKNGAYSELFAGLDESITQADNGGWVSPYGKLESVREDLLDPVLGKRFWEWCEEKVRDFM